MYKRDQILNAMEKCLDDHEKAIFKARHGFDSAPMTLEQLCSYFHISQDDLFSIENKVLRSLRQEGG